MKTKNIIPTLLFFIIFSSLAIAVPVCEFTFSINKNDQVTLRDYAAFDDTARDDRHSSSSYQAVFQGATTIKKGVPAIFYISDVGETDQTSASVQALCDPTWNALRVEKNGKTIFEKNIEGLFCNHDDICQEKENNLVCPDDCTLIGDGYCSYQQDGICDSDCITGEPDCQLPTEGFTDAVSPSEEPDFAPSVTEVQEAPPIQPKRTAVFVVIGFILVLLIVILIFTILHERKKKTFAQQKFDEYYKK